VILVDYSSAIEVDSKVSWVIMPAVMHQRCSNLCVFIAKKLLWFQNYCSDNDKIIDWNKWHFNRFLVG
jgi:hypothetical protein